MMRCGPALLLLFAEWFCGCESGEVVPLLGKPLGGLRDLKISGVVDRRTGESIERVNQESRNIKTNAQSVTTVRQIGARPAIGLHRHKRQAIEVRVYGFYYTGIDEDLAAAGISLAQARAFAGQAEELAKAAWAGSGFDVSSATVHSNLFIYFVRIRGNEGRSVYAYNVTLEVPRRLDICPSAYVGVDGTVYKKWNNVKTYTYSPPVQSLNQPQDLNDEAVRAAETKTALIGTGPGGNVKVGWWIYGTTPGYDFLNVTVKGDQCIMENGYVRTINCQNSEFNCLQKEPHTFQCSYNRHQLYINGAYSALNDVHYFTGKVFEMFKEYLGKFPVPGPITALVHYGVNYPDAFYTACPQFGIPGTMVFGDGGPTDLNYGSYGRVAHEVAHAFIDRTSNLLNFDQQGGIGESLADITEMALMDYVNLPVNYKVGYEVKRGRYNGGQLRCMDDPTCDGLSIDNISDYRVGMDVHQSSGIFNKVFYTLAQRFPGGIRDAWTLMMMTNFYGYVQETDFNNAALTMVYIATDLREGWFGTRYPFAEDDILYALRTVGINCTRAAVTDDWNCPYAPLV